jgi:hypothetical protein
MFDVVRETAQAVRTARAVGVAIFLPVNPLFRDAQATAAVPRYRLDDGNIRDLVSRTLEIYHAAGFVTADRVDAVPATGFFDLVHMNGAGMRAFSDEAATIIATAVRRTLSLSVPR